MPKFHLVLVIHSHQPAGNFDGVFEQTYQRSYLPFVESIARHPAIRMGLHYSGPLLEWCEQRHPEFMDLLRQLVASSQVELVGGGFYEPILVSISRVDQAEQISRLHEYLVKTFGAPPAGAWLAERVWEPQLAGILATAGVRYTIVDDVHFIAAGFESHQLHGDYVAEDCGQTVRVFPGLQALRYLLPFRPPEDTLGFLRDSAANHPGGMAAMGDDCEKFGAWPGTYEHCYGEGRWVERFFAELEAASDWLAVTPPGEYLAAHAPLGRADLPTASYSEMMEWVLPTPSRTAFHAISQEFAGRPDVSRFLRGGHWRGFFSKYSESNLLNKKMLRASERLAKVAAKRFGPTRRGKLDRARTHLLRAQCNDAYWHGVFGGLYAPHLRTEPWRELVRAETLAHEVSSRDPVKIGVEQLDYDADGCDEFYVTSRRLAALIRPADGGTVAALDFRPNGVTLINSMQRRPESYHQRLREASQMPDDGRVASIHDQVRSKEAGLERFLQYDRWPRNSFRLLLFPGDKRFQDYQLLKLDEHPELAGGAYTIPADRPSKLGPASISPEKIIPPHVSLVREAAIASLHDSASSRGIVCDKSFSFAHEGAGYRVDCAVELAVSGEPWPAMQIGVEIVLNFLAPDEPDRYFESGGGRHLLRWAAAIPGPDLPHGRLRVVDEWQNVAATFAAPGARQVWVAPIETVSESEEGFERVYQGSQILAVWPVTFSHGALWRSSVSLHIEPARPPDTQAATG